ncbi:MAG: 8-oxo-dGTP diphosphatase [bacterium]|nr:8-oxo-dGTP diphosphatase [bacterium]
MRLVNLLYIVDGPDAPVGAGEVLLGKKKVRFGAGYWNGFGGGVEAGESIEQSACREAQEEVGLVILPQDLTKVAHIKFHFEQKPEYDHDVHVFITKKFTGEPTESEEMSPQWHTLANLPMQEMWPSDPYWVPLVLQKGKTVEAICTFLGREKPFPVGKFEYAEVKF